jgi:hypothetical protein
MNKKPRIRRTKIEKVTSSKEWREPDADYHKSKDDRIDERFIEHPMQPTY